MCLRNPLICWLTDRSSTRANQPPKLPNFCVNVRKLTDTNHWLVENTTLKKECILLYAMRPQSKCTNNLIPLNLLIFNKNVTDYFANLPSNGEITLSKTGQ